MSNSDGLKQEKTNSSITAHTELSDGLVEGISLETGIPVNPDEIIKRKYRVMMWLIISGPPEHRGTVLPIADGTIIGRRGDIPWDDARMSRQHAKFHRIEHPEIAGKEVFAISPQKDRNGTLVNGRRIQSTTPLRENDVIIMGDTRFVVKVLR